MYRIDNTTAIPNLPAPEPPGTPGFFTSGNPAAALLATRVDAWWLNMLQEEVLTVVQAAGITPAKDRHTQLLEALNSLYTTTAPDLSPYLTLGQADARYLRLIGGTLATPGNLQVNGTFQVGTSAVRPGSTLYGNISVFGDVNVETSVVIGDVIRGDLQAPNNGVLHVQMGLDVTNGGINAHGDSSFNGDVNVASSVIVGNVIRGPTTTSGILSIQSGVYVHAGPAARPGDGPWDNLASDRRLKQDIEDYQAGLETIQRLHPVRYRYNGRGPLPNGGRIYYGIIADEVATAMPELILGEHEVQGERMTRTNSGPVTWALVNAVKQLAERVEALEATD